VPIEGTPFCLREDRVDSGRSIRRRLVCSSLPGAAFVLSDFEEGAVDGLLPKLFRSAVNFRFDVCIAEELCQES
jgi:hypothetical protein